MLAGFFFAFHAFTASLGLSQCIPCPPLALSRLPCRILGLPWPCLAILGALLGFLAFPPPLRSRWHVTESCFGIIHGRACLLGLAMRLAGSPCLLDAMKVTAILRDFSQAFYEGFPPSIPSFLAMNPREQYETLVRLGNERVPLKIGNGSFRDRVEHNQIHRDSRCHIAFKLEPRKGYKLGTFEFTLA